MHHATNFALAALAALSLVHTAHAHGTLIEPPPRGLLRGHNLAPKMRIVDHRAPRDFKAHFPAGDKNDAPGSGLRSQERTAKKWTVFQPMRKGFQWRASVCGDLPNMRRKPHLRGGEFYHRGRIVKTYKAGSIVSFRAIIAAHHNGFFEFHLCNVGKCGGEISGKCFRTRGACVKLRRAYTPQCDGKKSRRCGPVDPNDRGRWYIPCDAPGVDRLGDGDLMRYYIPKGFHCKHCVLHFYWSAANSCNPPGVVKYFTGPSRPSHWPRCHGQGGAIRGWTSVQKTCGERFPEEYYQCADVRVVP